MSRGRIAAVAGVLATVAAVGWLLRVPSSRIGGEAWAETVQEARSRDAWLLWVDRPEESLVRVGELLGRPGLTATLAERVRPGSASWLGRPRSLILTVDEESWQVDASLSPLSAVGAKAWGIVSSQPWLSGGGVEVAGRGARVSWRSEGGFASSRWTLRVAGAGAIDPEPVRFASRSWSAVVVAGERGVWALRRRDPGLPAGGMVWVRIDGDGIEGAGSEGGAMASRPPPNDGPWWATVAPSALIEEVDGSSVDSSSFPPLLVAVARRGSAWQSLLWQDAPVENTARRVRVELPRTAVASGPLVGVGPSAPDATSGGGHHPWSLPGEEVSRRLGVDVEVLEDDGLAVRSLSPRTSAALLRSRPRLQELAAALGEGETGAWVRPARLVEWWSALQRMGAGAGSLVGAGASESSVTGVLRELGAELDGDHRILVHWFGDRVVAVPYADSED